MLERIDKGLFFSVLILTIFGLIMISSVSIVGSFEISGENDYYFWRHFIYILAGIPIFLLGLKFPLEKMKQWALLFFILSLIFLFLTFFIGIDNGTFATLWIKIGSLTVQPVEIVKLATIIFLSTFFANSATNAHSWKDGLLPLIIVMSIPCIILAIQSDYGSLLILLLTTALLYFSAGANLKHFLGIGIAGFLTSIGVIFTNDYILHRIKVFFNPDLDPLNTGFQIKQALIAIGSGGLFGRGFQNSIQKYDYLPEVQSDTIFAAIAEEMGFFFVLFFIGLYLFIGLRGIKIAQSTTDNFQKFLALGITSWFVGQAFINIAVNMALSPNTGITLPLISYGGTSLLMSLASMGILLNISGQTHAKKKKRLRI